MPDSKEVHSLWSKLYDAARMQVIRATVPILAFQNNVVIQAGSGVLFKVADRHFVFTAAHVLDLAIEHSIPLTTGPVQQNGLPLPLQKLTGGRSPFPPGSNPKARDARQNDPFDVGYFELSQNDAAQLALAHRFATLQEVDVARVPQGCYLVLGYPNALSATDVPKQHLSVHTVHYLTDLASPFQDNQNRLNLKYRLDSLDRDGSPRAAPLPHGISGCGVWRLSTVKPFEQWSIDQVKLAGIEHAWDKDNHVLKESPIDCILRLLYRGNPDIRKVMDLHLGMATQNW